MELNQTVSTDIVQDYKSMKIIVVGNFMKNLFQTKQSPGSCHESFFPVVFNFKFFSAILPIVSTVNIVFQVQIIVLLRMIK